MKEIHNPHEIRAYKIKERKVNHQGLAWLLLCLAFTAHVIDEALTDFLSVFNPAVQAIRQTLPFLPLQTFTFRTWLTVLILTVSLLLLLTPFAFRRAKWIRLLSYPYGIIMLVNGLYHIAVSFYLGWLMPGVYTSPLLLASSIYLLWSVRQDKE